MKSSGNPVPILLKAASDSSLAPAQLEKVGMVYNNMLALAHLKKSATDDRGSSFPLLDVADLVETYKTSRKDFVSNGPLEKTASAPAAHIRDAGTSWPLASAFVKNSIFKSSQPKRASAPAKTMKEKEGHAQSYANLIDLSGRTKRAAEETEQVVFEIVPEINSRVESLLRKYSSGKVYAEVCEDMNLLGVEEARPALDLLSLTFQKRASGVQHWNGQMTRRLVTDRHNAIGELVGLSGLIRTLGEAQETASELRKQSSEIDELVWIPKAASAQRNPKSKKDDRPVDKSGPNRESGREASNKYNPILDYRYMPPDLYAERQLSASSQAPTVYVDTASAWSEIPKEMAQVQSAWQEKILERKRLANLSRVMIQDPIVSTADPVDVMEIYNNLIPLDPNIADKPMLMAQTMRTAIQQQTIDPHELKTLLEIEKNNLMTNKMLAEDLDRRSYKAEAGQARPSKRK